MRWLNTLSRMLRGKGEVKRAHATIGFHSTRRNLKESGKRGVVHNPTPTFSFTPDRNQEREEEEGSASVCLVLAIVGSRIRREKGREGEHVILLTGLGKRGQLCSS